MKRILICAALLIGMSNANATLISANDAVYGAGSLTQDTVTGLEWLDLTISQGFSYNNVINGVGNSFLANGFVVATLTQVEAFLTAAGWNGVDDSANNLGVTNHLATVTTLINLLGTIGTNAFPGELAFTKGLALIGSPGNVATDGLARQFNTITQSERRVASPARRLAPICIQRRPPMRLVAASRRGSLRTTSAFTWCAVP